MSLFVASPPPDFRTYVRSVWHHPVGKFRQRNKDLQRVWRTLLDCQHKPYRVVGRNEDPIGNNRPGTACLVSASVALVLVDTYPLLRIVRESASLIADGIPPITNVISYCYESTDGCITKLGEGKIETWQTLHNLHNEKVAKTLVARAVAAYWYDIMPDQVRDAYFSIASKAGLDARDDFADIFERVLFRRETLQRAKRRHLSSYRSRVKIVETERDSLSRG